MTLDILPLQTTRRLIVRQEFRFQFKLIDVENQRPAEDLGPLRALVLHPADGWQGQCWARPIDGDRYEMSLPIHGAGDCFLFFDWPGADAGHLHPTRQTPQRLRGTAGATGRAAGSAANRAQC